MTTYARPMPSNQWPAQEWLAGVTIAAQYEKKANSFPNMDIPQIEKEIMGAWLHESWPAGNA